MRKIYLALAVFLLVGCAGNPVSYLPTGKEPIVNIEAPIADLIKVDAQSDRLWIENVSESEINVVYKLFWYDIEGVSQHSNEDWQNIWLAPHQNSTIPLDKPTEESENYRIYLRNTK